MGTARMRLDPKTSVLNGYNQCHDIPNFFVIFMDFKFNLWNFVI